MRGRDILRYLGSYITACLTLSSVVAFLALYNGQSTAQAGAFLGNMKADRILFLGNSITLAGTYNGGPPDAAWGCAASARSKDYVHLLASSIDVTSGGSLELTHLTEVPGRWFYGDPLPNYEGNILNIADIFERNYNTWKNVRIQKQLDAKPDIVILQFGENLAGGTPEQLATALETLLLGLKNTSNPKIFITSQILGANPTIDAIKKKACAADPSHRFFVEITGVDTSGYAGHPSDAGMKTIADTIFNTMVTNSVPEPKTLTLLLSGCGLSSLAIWRRRR